LETSRLAIADPPQDRVDMLLMERWTAGNQVVHERPAQYQEKNETYGEIEN
jgi:hypothetical protein